MSIFVSLLVRANKLCADATHGDINNICKDWFRYACDREGGRKEERKEREISLTVHNIEESV